MSAPDKSEKETSDVDTAGAAISRETAENPSPSPIPHVKNFRSRLESTSQILLQEPPDYIDPEEYKHPEDSDAEALCRQYYKMRGIPYKTLDEAWDEGHITLDEEQKGYVTIPGFRWVISSITEFSRFPNFATEDEKAYSPHPNDTPAEKIDRLYYETKGLRYQTEREALAEGNIAYDEKRMVFFPFPGYLWVASKDEWLKHQNFATEPEPTPAPKPVDPLPEPTPSKSTQECPTKPPSKTQEPTPAPKPAVSKEPDSKPSPVQKPTAHSRRMALGWLVAGLAGAVGLGFWRNSSKEKQREIAAISSSLQKIADFISSLKPGLLDEKTSPYYNEDQTSDERKDYSRSPFKLNPSGIEDLTLNFNRPDKSELYLYDVHNGIKTLNLAVLEDKHSGFTLTVSFFEGNRVRYQLTSSISNNFDSQNESITVLIAPDEILVAESITCRLTSNCREDQPDPAEDSANPTTTSHQYSISVSDFEDSGDKNWTLLRNLK